MADEDWVTRADAARLLCVTRQRIDVLARAGGIAARQVSKKLWLVRRDAVEARVKYQGDNSKGVK